MLNVRLFYSLMAAIPKGKLHVIIVGDVDQLPPIGAGFVLKIYSMVTVYLIRDLIRFIVKALVILSLKALYAINRGEMPKTG